MRITQTQSPQGRTGFSLVELLVALAIIQLLVAIAVPLYLNSLHRSKQSTTMANIKAIAGAWEARAADYKSYNAAGANFQIPAQDITATQMRTMLVPTYMKNFPDLDGWRRPLDFHTDRAYRNRNPAMVYSIRSLGRDGQIDNPARQRRYTVGPFKCFDCDIVFSNGQFMAWPEGEQKH